MRDDNRMRIAKARNAARTRLLTNKEAQARLRASAAASSRKTLAEREAVTEEQLAEWAAEKEATDGLDT